MLLCNNGSAMIYVSFFSRNLFAGYIRNLNASRVLESSVHSCALCNAVLCLRRT